MSCIEEIMSAARRAGIEIEEVEAKEIEAQLEQRLSKKVLTAEGEDQSLDLFKLAKQIATNARIAVALEKRSKLINARSYTKIMTKLNTAVDSKTGKVNPALNLQAMLTGNIRILDDGLRSVDRKQQSIGLEFVTQLQTSLKSKDLDILFKSGELDELITKAMFDGPDTLDISAAGVKDAIQISEVIKKVQKKALERKNSNGAMVRELLNYVVRQAHDSILLRKSGKVNYINYMLERDSSGNYLRLSDQTFENKSALKGGEPYTDEEFIGDIFDNLVTGQHQKVSSGEMVDPLKGYSGTSNLAKKMSASRVIHFKNGQAAYDYSKKYARQSLLDSVTSGLQHDGQSIGLMETFGTNPQAMFERVLRDVKELYKSDFKIQDAFNDFSLKNQFKELDGSTRARGSGKLYLGGTVDFAGINAAVRMWQHMSKLGAATISSFSDFATKASFINSRSERNLFSSYAIAFGDMFKNYSGEKQKQLAYLLNVGIENWLGDVHSRFGANDSGPGMISKAHQLFFKANGMSWWNNAQKVGLARMLSADLANYSNVALNDIPIRTRLNLQRYGITSDDWATYSAMEKKALDGNNYLVPSAIDTVDRAILEAATLREINATRKKKVTKVTDDDIQKYKNSLTTKLSSYFTDAADSAIPTPGARERAMMNLGTERGNVLGEAIRAVMQLKAFPITMVTKGMSQQYYAKQQAGQSGIYGLAQMMIGTTVMGYLSMTVKDVLKGKNPAEVYDEKEGFNSKTFIRAFTQGGGAGIYGDFIFGEFNRFGQSPAETLIGPTFGGAADVLKLWTSVREGNVDAVTTKGFRFLVSNTPYINLFYTKTALDYLFIYGMMEKANPGYLNRMEKKMQKDAGQDYYISSPSSSAVRY
tara:strand:- start:17 stop:2638 length:2622 start_codon:yes stop_codon:yes gene_type:complete